MNPHPTNLSNHPQLIFNYPRSMSTTPSPQTQHTISTLTQSSFHPSPPSRNNLQILQWNANGIRPRRTQLTHFLSQNQYDLIFVQESHLSSDSSFRIPGDKTLQKNRSMTKRGKPWRWCIHTCQKRPNLPFILHIIPLLPRSQLRLFSYHS